MWVAAPMSREKKKKTVSNLAAVVMCMNQIEQKEEKKNEMEKFSCPLKTPQKAVILKGSASHWPSLCV